MYDKLESFSCQTNMPGEKYIYRYFLLQTIKKILVNDCEINVPCYGIEISSEKIIDDRIVDIYSENIKCMSPEKNKVLELIDMLRENEVSPVHLVDITGDKVDEWVSDFEPEISDHFKKAAII